MAKYSKWSIVKRLDTGEYYPALNERDIHWVRVADNFVNQNGIPIEIEYNMGKVTDGQLDMFWKGFLLAQDLLKRDMEKTMGDKTVNEQLTAASVADYSQSDVLKEILKLAKEELHNEEDSIGFTMPDGKYHLYIYVDETDEKLYVIEPNRVEDGAHEPFTGDTYLAAFGDLGELMVGCMWALECFEKDMESQNEKETSSGKQMFNEVKKRIFDSFESGASTYELGDWEKDLVHVYCEGDIFEKGTAHFVTEESHFFYDMEIKGQTPAHEAISNALANLVVEGKLQLENKKEVSKISLKEFLAIFDFDYEVSRVEDWGEKEHREKLVEEMELDEDNIHKPMLRLVCTQGANLGGIEGDRFAIDEDLVRNLISRLDVYVNDMVISEFEEALEERDVDASKMDLAQMVKKARELQVGDGEVCYAVAEYILHPELVDVSEVVEEASKEISNKGLDEKITQASGQVKGSVGDKEYNRGTVHRDL